MSPGSSGLIGSDAVAHCDPPGHRVVGLDNKMRREFFGEPGDTTWNVPRLRPEVRQFIHHDIDIQGLTAIDSVFAE